MSVTTAVPSRLNASEGRRIAPTKSACPARLFAHRRILLVERVMRGDDRQDAAGLQRIQRLGNEVIMECQPLAVIVELDIGKRRIADHGVDLAFGQPGVAETLDADVGFGMRVPWRCGRRCCPARRR